MLKQLFINLPVKNIETSKEFFMHLGLEMNKTLSDENASCFILEDNILIVLLPESYFKMITNSKEIHNETTHEMLLSVGLESRDDVNKFVDNAVRAGAKELHEPQESGNVYGRTFADLDDHQWNVFYMQAL
jgi:predicted lactoylglutathione lyase